MQNTELLKLAWRNIWRNRRRSVITITSIFIALFFCTILTAFIDGTWNSVIDGTLKTQSGHIEICHPDYWNDKTVDNFMTMSSEKIAELRTVENVENLSPRIETFAMTSHGTLSKGIAITGISPENERIKQKLDTRLSEGVYLSETDDGALIGRGLADYLKVRAGDTLALLGQGYHGASAAALFPVRGILKLPVSEMNNSLAYITLYAAQSFIDLPDGYSAILISLKNERRLNETLDAIRAGTNSEYDVLSWHFTMKDLLRTSESDKAFSKLIKFILYLIVGFGILGVVIMLTTERRREFAILISIGMKRRRLQTVFALEMLIIAAIAVVVSLCFTVPVIWRFHTHPIEVSGELAEMYADMGMDALMPMAMDSANFILQILVVFIMTGITLIYPFIKIRKLKITAKE